MSLQDKNIKYSVINLGCRVNRSESDVIESCMSEIGCSSPIEAADIIFINTCTVTATADKKTRKAVNSALRANDHAKIVVIGCAANMYPQYFKSLSERVEVADKFNLIEDLKQKCNFSPKSQFARANVKIQDGCDNACTFCIVHTARGKSRSIKRENVIETCKKLDREKTPEIVLSGINLGSYDDPDLAALLRYLLEETDYSRYRISSIEPPQVTDELLKVISASNGRVCKHFHLPLQSGSDRILKKMDRHYSVAEYLSLVDKIYQMMPDFSITTDIIVGFPGESEDDFEETCEVAKKCHFSKIHVFPYSIREGTPAATMPDQIDKKIKDERSKRLIVLSDTMRRREFEKRCGSEEYIAVENENISTTESYFSICTPQNAAPKSLIKIKLDKAMFVS